MIRVELTAAQRRELRARTRAATIAPRTRDRLETVRLADAGWSVPRIARHRGCHAQTVRTYAEVVLAAGCGALPDRPRPGRPPVATAAHLAALERLLDAGDRTWTTPQSVAWLDREHGVRVHPDHLSRLRPARRFGGKRTVTSVAPQRRAAAASEAKVRELDAPQKRPKTA